MTSLPRIILPYNFEPILEALAKDPLKCIANCKRENLYGEADYVDERHLRIATAYEFARQAKGQPEVIEKFYSDRFFASRTYKPKAKDILRMSLLYIHGEMKGRLYERACNYEVTLQELFDANADVHTAGEYLREHGLEKAYRAAVSRRKSNDEPENGAEERVAQFRRTSQQSEAKELADKKADEKADDNSDDKSEVDENFEADESATSTTTLDVEVSGDILSRILNMKIRGKGVLTIRRDPSGSNRKRIVGIDFSELDGGDEPESSDD